MGDSVRLPRISDKRQQTGGSRSDLRGLRVTSVLCPGQADGEAVGWMEELLGAVERWVETSGRALELRVARAVRRNGADRTVLSFGYEDPNETIQREGDVLSHFTWRGAMDADCAIEVVIECKSGTSKPWVGFYDGRMATAGGLNDWTYFAHGSFTALTQPLSELWAETPTFLVGEVATHIAAAHGGDNNPAGDAIRQVLSATEARRKEYLRGQGSGRKARILVPAVVTAAPLITCRLDGKDMVQLERVTRVVVRGRKAADGRPCRVYVMNESDVASFARDMSQCALTVHEHSRTL